MCATALLVDARAVEQLPSIVVFPLTLLGSVTIFGFAIGRMTFDQRELSTTDHLTGALTRAALREHIGHLVRRDAEREESIAMLVADLDHFKAINDEHGHAKGDEVLAAAAERIRSTLRPLDALYRVGGEEFLVILEGVDETAAGNIAERVRAAFHRQPLAGMPVTVSLGVAALAPGQPFEYDGLFASADAALLAAKAAGRDGVMAHAELRQPLAA